MQERMGHHLCSEMDEPVRCILEGRRTNGIYDVCIRSCESLSPPARDNNYVLEVRL